MRESTKTHIHCKKIGIGGYRFERVSSFPYLGSITNEDNSISEEITHTHLRKEVEPIMHIKD